MKRNLIFVGMMSIGLVYAQEGRTHNQHENSTKRVGINTDKPAATLDLRKTDVPSGQVEGFLLPHLNQTERDAMTREALVEGLQIYNTTKRCIDWWNGSEWQCTNGTQKDNHSNDVPVVTTPMALPKNITILDSKYWISSIYDTDYLPYTPPTEKASWNNIAPIESDGNPDKTINVQGIIPADGLTVYIPVVTIGYGVIPAYSTSVNILAERTQEQQSRMLTLSWEEQIFTQNTKTITAKLIPSNKTDIRVKQLDLKGGLGSDQMGLILAKFKIPRSSADGSDPTQYTGVYEVRAISGIPDKYFGIQTNGKYEHQYLYIPFTGPNGNLWLNNNLGADYADVDSPYFNPNHQAGARDYKTRKLLTNPTEEQIRQDAIAIGAIFNKSSNGIVYDWYNFIGLERKILSYNSRDICPEGWIEPEKKQWEETLLNYDIEEELPNVLKLTGAEVKFYLKEKDNKKQTGYKYISSNKYNSNWAGCLFKHKILGAGGFDWVDKCTMTLDNNGGGASAHRYYNRMLETKRYIKE